MKLGLSGPDCRLSLYTEFGSHFVNGRNNQIIDPYGLGCLAGQAQDSLVVVFNEER